MKKQQKVPKKKNQPRQPGAPTKIRQTPAAAEAQERVTEPADTPSRGETSRADNSPSREEVVTNWSKPVTNQDDQDKITNAGEGDIPIANK